MAATTLQNRGKRILALDTTTFVSSLALSEEGAAIAELTVQTRVAQSESLLADVDGLLRRVGWTLGDLDGLAVAVGPGSFTGVRIGVTTARTLAWTLGRPLVGCGSLEVLAQNAAGHPGLVVPVLDARKREVYVAAYRTIDPADPADPADAGAFVAVVAPQVLPPARALSLLAALPRGEGEPLWLLGDGVTRYADVFRDGCLPGLRTAPAADHRPRAACLGALGHAALEACGWRAEPKAVVPRYVRASEAEIAHRAREAASSFVG